VIGFLGVSSLEKLGGGVLLDFKRGLAETGYVEDRNVRIEYRRAGPPYGLPAQATTQGGQFWTPIGGQYSTPVDTPAAVRGQHGISEGRLV
jgi:hypothetical protein